MIVKKVFRSVIVLLLFIVFGAGALIINFLIFPLGSIFIKDKEKRKFFFCAVIHKTWKFFTGLMIDTGIINIEYNGFDKLKNISGKIIVANHPSFIDIVLLIGLLPNTICIAKKDLKKNIFMGNIVKSLFLINDENKEKLLTDSLDALKNGFNIIIFPSGTRTQSGEKLLLHKGAAITALHSKADIIPILISCDTKFLAKKQKTYEAGDKTVIFRLTVNETIKIDEFSQSALSHIQKRNRLNEAIKAGISEKIQYCP